MLTQLEVRFDEMSGQIIDRSMWILLTSSSAISLKTILSDTNVLTRGCT